MILSSVQIDVLCCFFFISETFNWFYLVFRNDVTKEHALTSSNKAVLKFVRDISGHKNFQLFSVMNIVQVRA